MPMESEVFCRNGVYQQLKREGNKQITTNSYVVFFINYEVENQQNLL
ncbi:hypothetical protein GH741_20080 [Aquibacillus halophilus]|uniref:Uncharacterized protein n=1 Tax=Aquibacillus halophilus TaxID=930132 RepID=A0A6A8DKE2_9BACI|nr:hypothetical protein [Aquibacillus halophilus]MRH44946.1 hypothetical protein [Aquibacillus halophilus]